MIVDDDVEMGDLLAEAFRQEGHEVWIARDGAAGLELVRARTPDLVILDVEMPVVSGPDMALAMLAHDLGLEEIPIVLCSGVLFLDEIAARVWSPYFLAKPYDLDVMSSLVARALGERAAPHPRSIL